MSIESRIQDFMALHKGDLSRFLAKAEAKLIELGHDVESIFTDEPAPDADDLAAATMPADVKAAAEAFEPEPTEVEKFDAEVAAIAEEISPKPAKKVAAKKAPKK